MLTPAKHSTCNYTLHSKFMETLSSNPFSATLCLDWGCFQWLTARAEPQLQWILCVCTTSKQQMRIQSVSRFAGCCSPLLWICGLWKRQVTDARAGSKLETSNYTHTHTHTSNHQHVSTIAQSHHSAASIPKCLH